MDEWFLPGWVIPFAWILVGWAIGFIDSNRRTANKIKKAETSAANAIKDAEDKVAEARARRAEAPTTPILTDDPGLMRVKDKNGVLSLELDGESMIANALTTEQRRRLIEVLNAIRPWLEGKPAMTPAPATPPPPKSSMVAPTPLASLASHPSPAQAAEPKEPKGKSAKKKGGAVEEAPPTSIVGQINLVLQQQIINTPLATRGVSLMESATGGVNVYVGVDRYEGVDDVPDDEIKAAIRAAIAEWERKYTPGLSS